MAGAGAIGEAPFPEDPEEVWTGTVRALHSTLQVRPSAALLEQAPLEWPGFPPGRAGSAMHNLPGRAGRPTNRGRLSPGKARRKDAPLSDQARNAVRGVPQPRHGLRPASGAQPGRAPQGRVPPAAARPRPAPLRHSAQAPRRSAGRRGRRPQRRRPLRADAPARDLQAAQLRALRRLASAAHPPCAVGLRGAAPAKAARAREPDVRCEPRPAAAPACPPARSRRASA